MRPSITNDGTSNLASDEVRALIDRITAQAAAKFPELADRIQTAGMMVITSMVLDTIGNSGVEDFLSRIEGSSGPDPRESWIPAQELLIEDFLLNYADSPANRLLFILGAFCAHLGMRSQMKAWATSYAADNAPDHADAIDELDQCLGQPSTLLAVVRLEEAVAELRNQRRH